MFSLLDDLAGTLAGTPSSGPELTDVECIDRIRALENLKNKAAAEQGQLAALLDGQRRAAAADRQVPGAQQGRGVAAEIAFARRESLHLGQQHLGLAKILRDEMPHTQAAFAAGRISEWRATILARETGCLSLEDRMSVDSQLAGNVDRLEAMGDRELIGEANKLAYKLDPHAYVARRAKAEAERYVSLRPAPDVMSQLSALLPVKQGVAVFASLKRAADTLIGTGDGRSRGQIMADTLVARITGATGVETESIPVAVNVIIPDSVLLGMSDEAAHIDGYGPIPADLARELAANATWLRRLYACPQTGALVAMDSRQRLFPDGLAMFIRFRDRVCRMPWCDAPIRHTDHAEAAESGGPTSGANGQGLCEAHNHAKQADGWAAQPRPGPRHTIETTTPTGHTYTTTAPPARAPRWVETRPHVWTLVA